MIVRRWEDGLQDLSTPPAMDFKRGMNSAIISNPCPLQMAKIRLLSRPKLNMRWRLTAEDRVSIELADTLRQLSMDGLLKGTWTKLGNEGKRSLIVGAIMKAMGMLPGAPDFVFLWENGSGWIELKAPAKRGASDKTGNEIQLKAAGTLSHAQKDFRLWSQSEGVNHAVCYSVDAAIDTLKAWGAMA